QTEQRLDDADGAAGGEFSDHLRGLWAPLIRLAAEEKQVRRDVAPALRERRRVKANGGNGVLGAPVRAAGDFDPQVAVRFTVTGERATKKGVRDRAAKALRRNNRRRDGVPGSRHLPPRDCF